MQAWKALPGYTRKLVNEDSHPVPPFRIKNPLMNMPEFGTAFDLPLNCPMVLPFDKRCDLLAGPQGQPPENNTEQG
jgi:hypothetical protein